MMSWMNEIAASYTSFDNFRVPARDEIWVRADVAPNAASNIKVTRLGRSDRREGASFRVARGNARVLILAAVP